MSEKNEILFSDAVVQLLADMWAQDKTAMNILYKLILAKQERQKGHGDVSESPFTIARLATEIEGTRREAIRDRKGKIIRYEVKDHLPIGRSKAEKTVDKLIYASLVEVEELPPLKILKITPRGEQVLGYYIKKREEYDNRS